MIVWNGLNKPAERSEAHNRERVSLSVQMTEVIFFDLCSVFLFFLIF